MNKGLLIGLAVMLLAGGAVFALRSDDTDQSASETTPTNEAIKDNSESEAEEARLAEEEAKAQTAEVTLNAAEVAKHASEDDCWTIVNGNVYDITSYLPRHPGGEEIQRACGTDGTKLFTERTAEDGEAIGSGTPHSTAAQSQLDALILGPLAD